MLMLCKHNCVRDEIRSFEIESSASAATTHPATTSSHGKQLTTAVTTITITPGTTITITPAIVIHITAHPPTTAAIAQIDDCHYQGYFSYDGSDAKRSSDDYDDTDHDWDNEPACNDTHIR